MADAQRYTVMKISSNKAAAKELLRDDKHYDRKLLDPMQTVFNTDMLLTKVANCMIDLGGMQVPSETLMQLPPEIWQQVDMPEMAELAQSGDSAQFKQVFDTLPVDLKMVLAKQIG